MERDAQDVTFLKDHRIRAIIEGIAHTKGIGPSLHRLPLTDDIFERMVTLIDSRGPISVEYSLILAAMAAGIYGLMRGGEFLQTTGYQREESLLNLNQVQFWYPNPAHTIGHQSSEKPLASIPISSFITRCSGDNPGPYPVAMSLTLKCSKNDAHKRGTEALIGDPSGIKLICNYLLQAHPAVNNQDSGLFLHPNGTRLTSAQLVPKMRELLVMINIPNPEAYMLHSLRKGGAQSLRDAGTSEEHIRQAGRWNTRSAAALYSQQSIQQAINISRRK